MRNTVVIVVLCFLIGSCTKDKFTTRPQLKYESVNNTDIPKGQIFTFTFSFTDAEGDLQDSLYIEKISVNCPNGGFVARYPLPAFPTGEQQKGEIDVSFVNGIIIGDYPTVSPACSPTDTSYFLFMLKDKAQNKSDTVRSDIIIIHAD